jgi:hypothetical protein
MTARLALLACLLGVFVGGGIGVVQEVLLPALLAQGAGGASDSMQMDANAYALPAEVVIRVNPPRSAGPRFVGLLDTIDTDHKGYVTIDDIKAYYGARVAVRGADASPMATR